ncbi:unnamed protein product [Calypogeia fissa]
MEPRDLDLEDNVKEHRRDAGRSGEEIERLMVDENLSDLERTKLFLSPSAHQLQISCAIEKLPLTFHEYKATAYQSLFPALTTSLENFSTASQVAAGEAIVSIVQDPALPKDVGLWLLPTALSMLNSNRIHDVLRVWLRALCAIIPMLPEKMICEDLMRLALSKGESQETVQSRTVCCAILGAIAPIIEPDEVEKNFLARAMALCQDTDLEVRVCMCEQLNAISRAVGVEITTEKVLPELFELLRDEEMHVQNAAFESLVKLLDFLPVEVRTLKIMPFVRPFVAPNEVHLLISVPRHFGELMCKMVADISEDDFEPLVDAYRAYALHSSEEVRQLCAANFPAVLKCVGARKYPESLHLLHMQIVQDTSSAVRSTIAASFHEVAKMLGRKRTASFLKEPLLLLLEDDSINVQRSILKVLPCVLGYFAGGSPQQKAAMFAAVLPSLLLAEEAASTGRQWRQQLQLLHTFAEMPEYISSDQIYESLVPICFRYMAEGVMPVKSAATMALAVFIRNNRRASQRYELALRVSKEYAQGRSYWSRLVFIDFCENMLKVASSRMFKDSFLDAAILTLQDPVPSVRMRACSMLPHLKYAIKLPDDVAVLEKINHLTTQRLNDSVKAVAAAALSLTDGLKNNLRNAINDREVTDEQAISQQEEFDRIDKLREEEEWNMLSKEEQDEKKKLDEMLLRLKLEGNTRKTTASGGSLTSTPFESASRHPSKSSGSGRTSTSNGSRASGVSSTSSRPQGSGDPQSRASVSKAQRLSGVNSLPASVHMSAHPNSVTPPFSTIHIGPPARRRDTSFVGTRSSQYRPSSVAAAAARPSSPAVNLRPETPVSSSSQDLGDHPVPVPSTHVVGQKITPAKGSKTSHVPRRSSNG